MKSNATIKIIVLSASALSPLVSVKVVHSLVTSVGSNVEQGFGGRPLPAITEIFLVQFGGSNASLAAGLSLTVCILMTVAMLANPKKTQNESISALQVFLAFIGPFLALLYLGAAVVAALVPFVSQVSPGG